jgi:glutathione S-transferase
MQQPHSWVTLVTVAALLLYFAFSIRCVVERVKHKIPAPAMTGHPALERALRVQGNTLEWLPIFLPSLWLFALYGNDRTAALLGLLWIVGRLVYALAYWADKKRGPGFAIQALATFILMFGAVAGAVRTLAATGGL